MKGIVRVCASALFVLGVAMFAWVSYDATAVFQMLGSQTRLDEAGVALIGFTVSIVLVALAVFSWRRSAAIGAA